MTNASKAIAIKIKYLIRFVIVLISMMSNGVGDHLPGFGQVYLPGCAFASLLELDTSRANFAFFNTLNPLFEHSCSLLGQFLLNTAVTHPVN